MSSQSLPKAGDFEILQVPDASANSASSPVLRLVMDRTSAIYASVPYEVEPGKNGWVFFVRKRPEPALEAPQSTNEPKSESEQVQPQ